MSENRINAEAILEAISQARQTIPRPLVVAPTADEKWPVAVTMTADTIEDFEYQAVIDGINGLAADLAATINAAKAAVMDDCMRVYYTAVDLARDPEHAHLIVHVEAMRAAYERDFGRPIPSREEWESGGVLV